MQDTQHYLAAHRQAKIIFSVKSCMVGDFSNSRALKNTFFELQSRELNLECSTSESTSMKISIIEENEKIPFGSEITKP